MAAARQPMRDGRQRGAAPTCWPDALAPTRETLGPFEPRFFRSGYLQMTQ